MKKNKIFIVTPTFSGDLSRGYEVVIATWIKVLSVQSSVEIISLSSSSRPQVSEDVVIKVFGTTIFSKALNLLGAILQLQPLQSRIYFNKKAYNYLAQLDRENDGVFIFFTLRSHCLFKAVTNKKKIIHAVDCMELNFKGKFQKEKNIIKKILYHLEYLLLKKREREILAGYNQSIFVASRDIDILDIKNAVEIPLVTLPGHKPYRRRVRKGFVVGMSGNFNYSPNVNAAQYLIDSVVDILPRDIQVRIIGFNAERFRVSVQRYSNVMIRNNVSDMTAELTELDVSLAPMQDGSGMQNKILDAMSLGIPVITNKFGLGSIKAEHNQSILLYSSPDELANLICQLRDNSSLLRRIGMGGLSIVDSYYSEAAVRQKICEVISD